eukprot:CAMPEP_0197671050 /NCGR_PEP_ID=MMETSP1338-20131121/75886_1 /TAXON_ID=43686 ORGANISM="Pelagodinium beii, Strain RCC1491" /NCGR_SAMPLE_ID=MMETSP1338 /ASSEMBLY_ACC=CAM_ASM_000754 /LENGTH=76 /DNA_ID=CAMNT_0043250879 /DNA_START=163 /DNA_END=390 /DNA_ORIENTATION=-
MSCVADPGIGTPAAPVLTHRHLKNSSKRDHRLHASSPILRPLPGQGYPGPKLEATAFGRRQPTSYRQNGLLPLGLE